MHCCRKLTFDWRGVGEIAGYRKTPRPVRSPRNVPSNGMAKRRLEIPEPLGQNPEPLGEKQGQIPEPFDNREEQRTSEIPEPPPQNPEPLGEIPEPVRELDSETLFGRTAKMWNLETYGDRHGKRRVKQVLRFTSPPVREE